VKISTSSFTAAIALALGSLHKGLWHFPQELWNITGYIQWLICPGWHQCLSSFNALALLINGKKAISKSNPDLFLSNTFQSQLTITFFDKKYVNNASHRTIISSSNYL